MNTAILIGMILGTTVSAFSVLIIYKHVCDLLMWREQALMADKHARMRQELVRYVSPHRQQMIRA